MKDPYPERRRHLDRTDHYRAKRNRRADRRGPSPQRVGDALEAIASHDVPGTPPVSELAVLQEIHGSEWKTDTRKLERFSITRGRPREGHLRSDDHIGKYVITLPIHEIDPAVFAGEECPDCGGDRAEYSYRAHHHISGSESLTCTDCEYEFKSKHWG